MQSALAALVLLLSPVTASGQPAGRISIGVCVDASRIEAAREAGFDYVEIGASAVASLTDEQFQTLASETARRGIPVTTANLFIPAAMKLVGPDIDKAVQEGYASKTLERLKRLGVSRVVLGSGGARRVPDGFPKEEAFAQLVDFCRRIAPLARLHGITIAVEPLRRQESNIINSAKEGLALVKAVDRPEIKLLVDYYHLTEEGESPDVLLEAGPAIVHVHVANPAGRVYPLNPDESAYAPFFARLCAIGYSGGVSIEASTNDFGADAPRAIAMLRRSVSCTGQ